MLKHKIKFAILVIIVFLLIGSTALAQYAPVGPPSGPTLWKRLGNNVMLMVDNWILNVKNVVIRGGLTLTDLDDKGVIYNNNGVITTQIGFEYDDTTNIFTVENMSYQRATGTDTFYQTNADEVTFTGYEGIEVSDDFFLGLSATDGKIVFDDQAIDEVEILNSNVGINTTAPQCRLDVNGDICSNGAVVYGVTEINLATYTILAGDFTVHSVFSGTDLSTTTLPSAGCVEGRHLKIKDGQGNAGTNKIVIDTQGVETIDGLNTLEIASDFGAASIYCHSSNWYIW